MASSSVHYSVVNDMLPGLDSNASKAQSVNMIKDALGVLRPSGLELCNSQEEGWRLKAVPNTLGLWSLGTSRTVKWMKTAN